MRLLHAERVLWSESSSWDRGVRLLHAEHVLWSESSSWDRGVRLLHAKRVLWSESSSWDGGAHEYIEFSDPNSKVVLIPLQKMLEGYKLRYKCIVRNDRFFGATKCSEVCHRTL